MQNKQILSALATALTLSLTTPALASATREFGGVAAASNSATALARSDHDFIQPGGPMIRVKPPSVHCGSDKRVAVAICVHEVAAGHSTSAHRRVSSSYGLARLVREWA